ncbi:hypothetical protein GCM10007116_03730 [Sulfodiicoccus acidiphilus]|uniref:Uncharacterized protein n=1 Tax=Sulfodiicoccus acidiphilus TaxID=1670455 RepID=A0A830GZ46_9CREN|nr:hypothetical protein [Sulfodiicoccus acidiphilus]GGT89152.1 hypothetical protein GCM10007116_03730 [Sulfodiicoccus acidiphilus]
MDLINSVEGGFSTQALGTFDWTDVNLLGDALPLLECKAVHGGN